MNSAVCSSIAADLNREQGRAARVRSAGRALLERRGIGDVAGVLSGLVFLLARMPVYALGLLLGAAVCCAGVLLYGLRALGAALAGGTPEVESAASIPQITAGGGPHG